MQDVREQLRYLLNACAARYRRTRAVESVAVVMTAGGCAAAVAQIAWSIAHVRPGAAGCVAAIGAAVGLILPLGPIRKILALSLRQALLCAGVMCAVSLAAVACCLLGCTDAISRPALLAVSLCAAGLTGLVGSYVYPPGLIEAAVYLDERCRLGERLSTAAELMGNCESRITNRELTTETTKQQKEHRQDARDTHGRDLPAGRQAPHATNCAQTVFEQALRVADEKGVLNAPLWRRTRATSGALGLTILLGMTLLLVPTFAPPGAAGNIGQAIAASLDEMSPQKKRRLVEAFLNASTQPAQPAEVRQALKDAGMAASNNDPKSLEDALAILDRAGYKLKAILPVGTTSGDAALNTGQTPTTTSPISPPITPPVDKTGADLVRVMNPDYKPVPADASQPLTGNTAQSQLKMLPWDTAWDIARARAANALADGQVPPRYRRLVRDFFSADSANGGEPPKMYVSP